MSKTQRGSTAPAGTGLWWSVLVALILILGYLTWAHFASVAVMCPAGSSGPINCTRVLTGPGSVVVGLPLPVWGGLWVLAGWVVLHRLGKVQGAFVSWLVLGGLGIVWALAHEWQDQALCLWCSVSQALMVVYLLLSIGIRNTRSKEPAFHARLRQVSWGIGGLWLVGVVALLMTGHSGGAQTVSTPSVPDSAASSGLVLRTLQNQTGQLPSGPTVVEIMAPWCEYCATTAKWLDVSDAQFAKQDGLSFALIDTSPLGGVGYAAQQPTLESIAQTAHDGSGQKLTNDAEVAQNLKQFQTQYALSSLPIFFIPLGYTLPSSWNATSYPTFVLLNAQHQPVAVQPGFMTASQYHTWLTQASAQFQTAPAS